MAIPYRARRGFRNFCVVLLILILIAILLLVCWFLWLDRYVEYSKDGAKLNFDLSLRYDTGETPQEPEPSILPEIHDKSEDAGNNTTPFAQLSGYYVTIDDLKNNYEQTWARLKKLPKGSTVMLELKDLRGNMYYSSGVAQNATSVDVSQVDELITYLQGRGHYLIASIPAFQEYYYIMEDQRSRVPYGLAKVTNSGALWMDTSGSMSCYWLSPASDGTITYLIQLITEIRNLGFQEIALSGYRFPDTDQVAFEGDKTATLVSTAATLVNTCATDTFAVSFCPTSAGLTLPEGRTRLYLENVTGSAVMSVANSAKVSDLSVQLVFLTESYDPRYDDYSVLRPIAAIDDAVE